MSETQPLVSVIVLNYRRLKDLDRCLDSVIRQQWPALEIIVVDNHSEEDVASVVAAKNANIRLIELAENFGPCVGRNEGIRAARGEILITIDNDVSFVSPCEVDRVVEAFRAHPDYHVLAFRICDPDTGRLRIREWCHPRDWRTCGDAEFETDFFGEGASAFRRSVFEQAGEYWAPLFIGHEGYELAIRILDAGFRILYCPRIAVAHSQSLETRPASRAHFYYTRNYIWIAYKNHRFWGGVRYLAPKLLMMFAFSVRAGQTSLFFRAARDAVKGLRAVPRTPMGRRTSAHIARLEQSRPGWIARLRRHLVETQL